MSELCTSISTSLNVTQTNFRHLQFLHGRTPIPVAARSKSWVCGRSLCWDSGVESRLGHGCLSLVSVACCQVQVSATCRSLVKRSPTEYGVFECELETSRMRRSRPTRTVEPWDKECTHTHTHTRTHTHAHTHTHTHTMFSNINPNSDLRY